MSNTVMTWIEGWAEAMLQILLDYGVIALKDPAPSRRLVQSPGPEACPSESNGQMLLPGIAGARRRELGREG